MRRLLKARRDDGRISILIAGFLGILAMLILGAVDVTAVQLARMRILDASDSAAADAADAIDEGGVYTGGVDGERLRLTDGSVRQVAVDNLGKQRLPQNVTSWGLQSGTGTRDGRTARVVLSGTVQPPISGGALGFFKEVTVTVESNARADVQP
ncbi:pilus assembly protein TadG-related protein [Demetria terragena]|uniref:pilus assembly protein TadG-related protein n=1 Tax=Demetria terragena TaxID=63959 RepID=UPI000368E200|nr:pilus assembly protein TadG-related protein [Demetria terragena]